MWRCTVLLAWILVLRSTSPCFGDERKERLILRHSDAVICTVFTPDGKTLISGDNDSIRLWDVSSGKERAALKKDDSGPKGIAVSPNGKMLASGNWDATVRLWDIAGGTEVAILRGHTGPVLTVAFSPDGSFLVTGARDNKWEKAEVKLWDLRTRTESASLPGVADPVSRLTFSPDGKTVAVGDVKGSVLLWDVASKRVRRRLKGHTSVSTVVWSRDGRRLVSGGNDIRVWDPAAGRLLATLPVGDDTDDCFGLAMTKDGKLLASGSHRGNIKIWDVAAGKAVLTLKQAPTKEKPTVKPIANLLKEFEDDVYCVAFSPDDTQLAAGVGPTLRVWDIKALAATKTGVDGNLPK